MGKRVRRKWDLPAGRTQALLVLCAAFFLGGLAGALFAGMSDGAGAEELRGYLCDYLVLAGNGAAVQNFGALIWEQFSVLLLSLLLGAAAFGVAGLPVLMAVRGFFFSFSVACFCRVFGGVGLILAFVLFGLPALLWGPALFLSAVQGLSNAWRLFQAWSGGTQVPAGPRNGFWFCTGLCAALAFLCAVLELMVVPVLLRAAAGVVL